MPETIGGLTFLNQRLTIRQWLAYVDTYDFGAVAPSRVVMHHTYIPSEAQWRGLGSMRGMQGYYNGMGWTAGPHIYTGPDGIWLGTPMKDVGIHAGTGNSGRVNGKFWYSIGVEHVGFFDKVLPGGNVWEYGKAVMGGLSRRLNIAPRDLISFHRDYTNEKSCPGWAVKKEWVWSEVEQWLRDNPPTETEPEPQTATVKADAATLRSTPYRVQGNIVMLVIRKDQTVDVLGSEQGQNTAGTALWYRVRYAGKEGYIHSGALQVSQ